MNPRKAYYKYVLAFLTASFFFLLLGIFIMVYSIQNDSSRLFIGGAGFTILGLVIFFREFIPWIKPQKNTNQYTITTCPYCGALTNQNATNCEKCKRQLQN
jgi:ribosomal protein L40E